MHLPKRAVALAVGALVSICLLFVLGRPWAAAEHDTYRTHLRQLRVHSAELEQDLTRARLWLPTLHGSDAAQFSALRQRAEALRDYPAFLREPERATLDGLLDGYVRALARQEVLLARFEAADTRAAALRDAFTRRAVGLLGALPRESAALRASVEALLAGVLEDARGEAAERRMAEALAGLVRARASGLESARGEVGVLEAEVRELLERRREASTALQALVEAPASAESERLMTAYLQLYERALGRAERFRVVLFGVSLLLVLYVGWMLVRLARASAQLHVLNTGLERFVGERTAALTASNAELGASEARKAAILEASPDSILLLDERGRVLELNPAAERTFGVERARAVGRDVRDWVPQREEVEQALSPRPSPLPLGEGQGEGGRAQRLEVTARREDGATFAAELTVTPVRGEGPPRLTAFVRDISERKEVERMKNEFVSTVSHELRTPLTSIRGSLGLLEGGIMGELPASALDMVRIARTNTERLIRLINDILDLEKMEAGKLELKLQAVEPAEVVEATFSGVRAMADGAKVALRAEVAGAPAVRADRDRLIQVLTNLLSNAIKFSPPGAGVVVRAEADSGGGVRFSVTDEGPGISPEQRGRLFGKFQQLDGSDTRSKGGTGLGLAISQAIVEQHGGRIEVHAGPEGRGSTFTFRLSGEHATAQPRASMASKPLPAPRAVGAEVGPAQSVLMVTGDAELSGLLRGLLTGEGYRVRHAGSLEEASREVGAAPPDILVVDAQLPDGSGLELVRRLREDARTSDLPVVVASGRAGGDASVGTPLRVDWMEKPLDELRLLKVLRYATRRPGQPRVLVVDDDAATRTVLCTRLSRLGVQCFEAADGESAVALARLTPPDLIVLDVGLPRLDGFAVVDVLRQGRGRTTPLIVFTGRELSQADRRQLTLGMTHHLTKARSSEDELVASVRELLNGLLARRDGEPEASRKVPS